MINNKDQITTSVSSKRSFSGQINNWRRNQQILTIFILLFIAVIFWIIVSLFSSQRDSVITPNLTRMAQPLNPSIDDSIFEYLESRRTFSEEELADFPIIIQVDAGQGEKSTVTITNDGVTSQATPTPRPTPSPTPTATPSLIENETETAQ